MQIILKNKVNFFFSFLCCIAFANVVIAAAEPEIIYANPTASDPYYPYKSRLAKDSDLAIFLYSKEILDKIPALNITNPKLIPWSFKGIPSGDKNTFLLRDIIADKIIDEDTGKIYNVMYHGTTSDLLEVFKPGASAIRFDVATNTVLGMGFYLSASLNEAKGYGCDRKRQRKGTNKDLKAMVLVVGVEDNDIIKGKTSPKAQLSNDKTGDPLDPAIFFKRNSDTRASNNRYNQFSFFSNVKPFLKIFKIVILPDGFGRSKWVQDYDGQLDEPNATFKTEHSFICN